MLGTEFSGNMNSTTYKSSHSVNHTINDFGSLRSMAVLSSRAHERRSRGPRNWFLCPRPPLLLSAPNQNRHATQAMTSAAITTLPKTTHNTSTVNTGETSSNYSVILSLSPHKSSHGTFLDSLTVDLFKIPDVDQRLKRRHTTPAFKTIFY